MLLEICITLSHNDIDGNLHAVRKRKKAQFTKLQFTQISLYRITGIMIPSKLLTRLLGTERMSRSSQRTMNGNNHLSAG